MMKNKILVVEDEMNLQQLYCMELEEEGYEVVTAANCRSALTRLAAEAVDLVLLDLALPDASGLECLQQCAEIKPKAKVVINTAYPLHRRDFHSWAADAFLIKSSDLSELKCTINHFLQVHQHELQKG